MFYLINSRENGSTVEYELSRCILQYKITSRCRKIPRVKYEKSLLSQLRYRVLSLRIETDRFVNESRENRICTLCNENQIEDQLHFVFHCPLYYNNREELYHKARTIISMFDNLSDIKLRKLFCHGTLGDMLKIHLS